MLGRLYRLSDQPISTVQICSAREAIYGAVQSLMMLANAQRAAGDRVEFITFAGKRFGEQVRNEKYAVHEVKVRAKVDLIGIMHMRRVIRSGGFDLVHTHLSTSSVNGALAARFSSVPCVSTVHGLSGKISFLAANHLIAVSGSVKRHMVEQGMEASRISVVYNGVQIPEFPTDREVARQKLGLPLDVPIVGTISRVTPMKGIDDAIRAVARLKHSFPNLRYIVVGDGDDVEHCRNLAMELGIFANVDFVGYQNNVEPYLAAMDLFLFPSLKEAMGIALVEAMASGLPIAATDVGGIPEVVTPEVGLLVGPKQPDALALAASSILSNPSLRLDMGESARRRAQRVFGVESMYQGTREVYLKLLGRQRSMGIVPRQERVKKTSETK
jgi:glycosyltransferase involved in cell wall biosynthesis